MYKKLNRIAVWLCVLSLGFGFWSCEQPVYMQDNPTISSPQNIQIIWADSQLTAIWDPVAGAEKYELHISDGNGFDQIFGAQMPIRTITGLVNRSMYLIRIRAIINGNTSAWSENHRGTPDISLTVPDSPVLRVLADDRALIPAWSAVEGAVSYRIFLNNVLIMETRNLEEIIAGLDNDVFYSIHVSAVNAVGESPMSNLVAKKPDLYIRRLVLGFGFNFFGELNSKSTSLRPILDLHKLNYENAIIIEDDTGSTWYIRTGETIKDVNISQNKSFGMGASVPYKAILLSAGSSSGYSQNVSENVQTQYALIRAEHFIKTVSLDPKLFDPFELRKYLTDGFLHALDNNSPRELFANYGHGIINRYRLGGSQEIYLTRFNHKRESLQQFRSALNADLFIIGASYGASVNMEQGNSTSISEYRSESELTISTNGGELLKAQSLEDAFRLYDSWVNSLYIFPSFAGISSYSNSFLPLWDIAQSLGKTELSKALKQEFHRQAITHVIELEATWPGQFFSYEERVYSPGSMVFSHPEMFFIDEDGNTVTVEVTYEICIGGSGAGGNGTSSWGINGRLNGGPGAGGAAIRFRIRSKKGLVVNGIIGHGGSGGTEMRGHAWPGPGISPGGDTIVTVFDYDFIAGGGQSSGYSDYAYHPASGGRGMPLNPPDFVYDYIIANGENVSGVWNQPGAGGKIGSFAAGGGGIGGTGSNGGWGRPGENGSVRIRWWYYDGQ